MRLQMDQSDLNKLLNHVENSVTAIYDRHGYDKEKKQAIGVWGQNLEILFKNTSDFIINKY